MSSKRDCNKRLKGFGIPIEVCVKYERMVGVKAGEKPTKQQAEAATHKMVEVLTIEAARVSLTSKDYELIAQEVKANEQKKLQ